MTPERVQEIRNWKADRERFPLITLKWAQSMDGQLADDDDCSQWISGPEERRYTHWLRSMHEAVLVGAQTFLKDRCQLTVRSVPFFGHQPARIVADPKGRLAQAFAENPGIFNADPSFPLRTTYVLVGAMPREPLPQLPAERQKHLVILHCPLHGTLEDWLQAAIVQLAKEFQQKENRPLQSLMVEGGAQMLGSFLRGGLADVVEIALCPLVLGGSKHRVSPDLRMTHNLRLKPLSTQQLGEDILLRFEYQKTQELRHAN